MSASENLQPAQFFHGTSSTWADKIESEGLRGGNDTGRWHVTSRLDHAQRHAREVSYEVGGQPTIYTVDLEGHPSRPGYLGEHHRTGDVPVPPERLRRFEEGKK